MKKLEKRLEELGTKLENDYKKLQKQAVKSFLNAVAHDRSIGDYFVPKQHDMWLLKHYRELRNVVEDMFSPEMVKTLQEVWRALDSDNLILFATEPWFHFPKDKSTPDKKGTKLSWVDKKGKKHERIVEKWFYAEIGNQIKEDSGGYSEWFILDYIEAFNEYEKLIYLLHGCHFGQTKDVSLSTINNLIFRHSFGRNIDLTVLSTE